MAKKDLGDIEGQNKNLGGVGALFAPVEQADLQNEKKVTHNNENYEVATYPLRMTKSTLKALKTLALKSDTTVKDLIMTAIFDKWKL